mmetsp:Transcript_1873/g.4089  ORF Transcript_1873/g.4089 Transcript_1873/m.4089 type:complete len:448 (-) Transcript_1873:646-1989(-)
MKRIPPRTQNNLRPLHHHLPHLLRTRHGILLRHIQTTDLAPQLPKGLRAHEKFIGAIETGRSDVKEFGEGCIGELDNFFDDGFHLEGFHSAGGDYFWDCLRGGLGFDGVGVGASANCGIVRNVIITAIATGVGIRNSRRRHHHLGNISGNHEIRIHKILQRFQMRRLRRSVQFQQFQCRYGLHPIPRQGHGYGVLRVVHGEYVTGGIDVSGDGHGVVSGKEEGGEVVDGEDSLVRMAKEGLLFEEFLGSFRLGDGGVGWNAYPAVAAVVLIANIQVCVLFHIQLVDCLVPATDMLPILLLLSRKRSRKLKHLPHNAHHPANYQILLQRHLSQKRLDPFPVLEILSPIAKDDVRPRFDGETNALAVFEGEIVKSQRAVEMVLETRSESSVFRRSGQISFRFAFGWVWVVVAVFVVVVGIARMERAGAEVDDIGSCGIHFRRWGCRGWG